MLTSQQFCVKWNSYSSNLQTVFPRLLTSEHFVDITLACEGQMIKCHKVVLSACSTYFEKLLVQNPCQHPIIFMKDMKHWEVQALVDFMYKGEVNVSQEELNSLLVAAEALQIRGLCGSDNAHRQKESTRLPTSPVSQVSSVTLPNDIVLSGGLIMGRESPPQKKRKIPVDEKDQCNPLQPTATRISSVSSLSGNKAGPDINSDDQFKDSVVEEFGEELQDNKIKQEMDIEEHYLEGEADAEGHEDDGGDLLEQPDDSDSNNREEIHSNAVLDQPGPSGISITGPAEKSAPDTSFALQNVMCVLSPSSTTTATAAATTVGKVPIRIAPAPALTPMGKIVNRMAISPEVKEYEYGALPSPGGSTRIRRSEEELRKAAECVQKGMTFQNVSDALNIPISTIRFYMARRGILPQRRRGRISNSGQSPATSQSQQPPYMVLHYKLPDINKKTT